MREVRPSECYQRMSTEDQIQFDRWLRANAVVASLFSAAVVAMFFLGAQSSEPGYNRLRYHDSFEERTSCE